MNIDLIKISTIRLINIIAITLLIGMIVISFNRPFMPWDTWAYHLPFSAKLFGFEELSKNFIFDKGIKARYQGFPLVAEFIQALLWHLTGSLSSTALINSISLAGFILCAAKYGKSSLSILTFGILSVPLISIHSLSAYIDLFFGVGIAFQYLSAVVIYRHLREEVISKKLVSVWCGVYILTSFVASNTKMWGPVISLSITFYLFYEILKIKYLNLRRIEYYKITFLFFIICLISCSNLIKNSILYKNPIYPIKYTIPVLNFHLEGPEPEYKNSPGYAENFGLLRKPIYFALSVTEYDWIIRGVEASYSIDSGAGDHPLRYSTARTGGLWVGVILVSLFLVVAMWVIAISSGYLRIGATSFPLTLFCFLILITCFMPQSHELRYFLYLPIILMFNLGFLIKLLDKNEILNILISFIYLGLFLFSLSVLCGESFSSLAIYKSQSDIIGVTNDAQEIEAAKNFGGVCLGRKYNPNQFKYSSALHGGSYIIEQGLDKCIYFPEYVESR